MKINKLFLVAIAMLLCCLTVRAEETSENIEFADALVKEVCIANWDTNGDGELSMDEAAAVTDLGNVFEENNEITSFNELQYFTGLTSIGINSFNGCTDLTSLTIPNNVTSIGGASQDCIKLTSVIVNNETPITLDYATTFTNRANATLYVPYGCKAAYEAADVWKDFKEIVELAPNSVSISINQYGSGTYCSEHALDFTDVEGMKAYVGIGFNIKTSTLIMSQARTVKPGVGLYIKGEPGDYNIPVIDESDENYINLMVGTLSKVYVNSYSDDGKYANYKYTMKSSDKAPKFYLFGGASLGANKAYLQLPTEWLPNISTAKTINIAFEDEDITGIDEFVAGSPNSEPAVYDMFGRKVVNPGKGLYIMNGKKVFVK